MFTRAFFLAVQKGMASKYNSGAVMEETFLSRFDALDVRVRKVLQTCAVLGLSFSLSDVVRVHPELEEIEIEHALDNAVEEIILVERFEDEDESVSLHSGSTGCDSDSRSGIAELERRDSKTSTGMDLDEIDDRFFEFSHAMWRQKVLTTMLKERKIELHRLIAEAMEKDQVHILEQCDISRLLTLFDHWKACGDFCKSAPLALAVGSRLEEWDLAMQSLDLYRDALEMSFESVEAVDENGGRDGTNPSVTLITGFEGRSPASSSLPRLLCRVFFDDWIRRVGSSFCSPGDSGLDSSSTH
jgi:hypothetical protein